MKLLVKLLKWLVFSIILIIALLYITGYGYIIKGARIVYFTGHTTAFSDAYPYFENDTIKKENNPQPRPKHKNYNTVQEAEKLKKANQDWGTIAYVIIKNDSVWFENYYD